MPDEKTLTRLLGDGKKDASGGGLPLPDALRAIFEYILDNGESSREKLKGLVQSSLWLRHKRVEMLWAAESDPWDGVTDDLISCLQDGGFLTRSSTVTWRLPPWFRAGKRYTVLPKRDGLSSAITVVVYSRSERERRSKLAASKPHLLQLQRLLGGVGGDLAFRAAELEHMVDEQLQIADSAPSQHDVSEPADTDSAPSQHDVSEPADTEDDVTPEEDFFTRQSVERAATEQVFKEVISSQRRTRHIVGLADQAEVYMNEHPGEWVTAQGIAKSIMNTYPEVGYLDNNAQGTMRKRLRRLADTGELERKKESGQRGKTFYLKRLPVM